MPSTSAVDWISLWKQGRVAVQAGSSRILNEYETPTTFVFLTATHAFKLRKPVQCGAIDYRTEPQRRLAARTEITIGQRISPHMFIGVWTLLQAGQPRLMAYDAAGEPMVVMARLAHELQLERLFSSLQTCAEMIDDVAASCAAFHAGCPADWLADGYGAPEGWLAALTHGLTPPAELKNPSGARELAQLLAPTEQSQLREQTTEWLQHLRPLLLQRIAEGRVREGHGDLRLKHVYLTRPWSVIDPLESSLAQRFTDVAAEVCFLAMELDDLGRQDASDRLLAKYAEAAGDPTLAAVAPLFKRLRAVARAQVAWERAARTTGLLKEAQRSRARRLFELALSY